MAADGADPYIGTEWSIAVVNHGRRDGWMGPRSDRVEAFLRVAVVGTALFVPFACGESARPECAVGAHALPTVGGQPLPCILDVSDPDTTLRTGVRFGGVRRRGRDRTRGHNPARRPARPILRAATTALRSRRQGTVSVWTT